MMQKFLVVVFTLAVIFVMVAPLWRSGVMDEKGNLLFDNGAAFYDAGVHLSLISEMQNRFPPTNFAYGGTPLKNYHYFYDAILAGVVKITEVSYFDLYYRIAPVALSLLLTLVIYLTAWELTKNRWTASLAIFFAVFGTSLGTLTTRGTNNVFMTDQIFDMMVNPQGVLSLIIFLSLFLLLAAYEKVNQKIFILLYSFLLAISFGVKAYGGIVFAAGTTLTIIWILHKKRDWVVALLLTGGLVVMALWVTYNLNGSAASLTFAPFWLLEKIFEDPDRLFNLRIFLKMQDFRQGGNWPGLVGLYSLALIVYLVGGMGLRVFALGLVSKFKINQLKPSRVFLAGASAISFFLPVIFNQGIKAYEVIQFSPYFTLISGIGFTLVLCWSINILPKMYLRAVVIAFFVGLFIWLDRAEINTRLNLFRPDSPKQIEISSQLLAAAKYMQANTSPKAIVLLAPTDQNLKTLWFTSLFSRRTAYSGEFFNYQIGTDTVAAKTKLTAGFSNPDLETDFDYVFLRKQETGEFGKIEEKYRLRRVFENNEALVLSR